MRKKTTRKKAAKKKATRATGKKVQLPQVIGFNEYYNIEDFYDKLKSIIPDVKHRELGLAEQKYQAIFYVKKTEEYKILVRKTETWIEDWHKKLGP